MTTVIFDSNAYVNLKEKIKKGGCEDSNIELLRECENQKQYVPYLHALVLHELISQYYESPKTRFGVLQLAARHAKNRETGTPQCMPWPEVEFACRLPFEFRNYDYITKSFCDLRDMRNFMHEISNSNAADDVPIVDCQKISDRISRIKDEINNFMCERTHDLREVDKSDLAEAYAQDFVEVFAKSVINFDHKCVSRIIGPAIEGMAIFAGKVKAALSNPTVSQEWASNKKYANSFFDCMLIASACLGSKEIPRILVTSDRFFRNVKIYNCDNPLKIISLDDYLKEVGYSSV